MISSIYLVAKRDYLGYVTAWGFWLGLLLTPILFGAGMIAPSLAASSQPERYFTVIDPEGQFEAALDAEFEDAGMTRARMQVEMAASMSARENEALDAFDDAVEAGKSPREAIEASGVSTGLDLSQGKFAKIEPPADTIARLEPWLAGERMLDTPNGPKPLFAAFVVTDTGIEYWSENVTVGELKSIARRAAQRMAREQVFNEAGVSTDLIARAEKATPQLQEKRVRPDSESPGSQVTDADRAPFIAAIAIAFMLWMLIFSVVNYLLMGTIEERSNKIFDTLLTSVKLPHLLAGKLLAVLAVSMTLMAVWSLGGTAISLIATSSLPPEVSARIGTFAAAALKPAILLPALVSFLLGYLMYGALFLALGSLCDTIQEAQTLMSPLLVLLMVPLLMLVFAIDDPETPIIAVMSWVPLFTPFLLIMRMPTQPPGLEVAGLLGLMALTTLVVLWLAARVYRAGAVHGAGVNDALAWMRGLLPGRSR